MAGQRRWQLPGAVVAKEEVLVKRYVAGGPQALRVEAIATRVWLIPRTRVDKKGYGYKMLQGFWHLLKKVYTSFFFFSEEVQLDTNSQTDPTTHRGRRTLL